ncbi:hypothetical protein [Nocardioides sp. GXQ0305]|uniref:hypothetical protein n=1 Tax=Nocardioides sp. GXQ0305 TaxID=3423912 RepID=UPI003D7D667A
MGILVTSVVVVVLVVLVVAGRQLIAKGSNPQVANGAVLLTFAAIVGPWGLTLLLSFVW